MNNLILLNKVLAALKEDESGQYDQLIKEFEQFVIDFQETAGFFHINFPDQTKLLTAPEK